jgi:DNA polymerase-1
MFDDAPSKIKLNYGSNSQIKELFRVLGEDVPKEKEKESVKQSVLTEWIITHPNSKLLPFLEKYVNRAKIAKQISTYGESFLRNIKRDGKLHTVFKQCFTDTARFSSGNSDYGYPNFQNIPANNKFRHCFGVEQGYEVTTCDLSGAELIVMCSLAQDMHLLELSKGDMHSHMANLCWSKIYESRGQVWDDPISKTNKKHLRTQFKAMTFGTIYGMYPAKAGKQLSVPKEEGKIVLEMIEKEIPVVFSMVKAASKEAERNGFVRHNNRTNSVRFFTPIIDAKKLTKRMQKEHPHAEVPNNQWGKTWSEVRGVKDVMTFKEYSSCLSAARNTRIQGTQADMLKEAIVVIDRQVKANDWDITLLANIHDELVYKHPVGYVVECPWRKEEVPVGDYIAHAMRETANLYLDNVKMGAEYETLKTWTK